MDEQVDLSSTQRYLAQRLSALELTALPIFVMDDERGCIPWANDAAARLFNARDRAELLSRDFSDFSVASRARIARYRAQFQAGSDVWDTWTMYPRGEPKTVKLHLTPIALDDGRIAFFSEAYTPEHGPDPSQLRGIEALRHTAAMVAMLDPEGKILMQNPAAIRAFQEAELDAWFVDRAVAAAVLGAIAPAEPVRTEALARTAAGERWHLVEARRTIDPVSGEAAILLEQIDVTQQREDKLTIARQHEEILALSTPLLAVGRNVLALPVIGTLDEERAARMTESALSAVAQRRIRHLILDLTGASRLDAASAEALVRLARAIRLLGARTILTGIQPDVAQVLVRAGAELRGTLMRRDLHQALADCADRER